MVFLFLVHTSHVAERVSGEDAERTLLPRATRSYEPFMPDRRRPLHSPHVTRATVDDLDQEIVLVPSLFTKRSRWPRSTRGSRRDDC